MRDTMRDLLNKLYSIVSESQLNPRDPKGDYEAKKQALNDLEADPVAGQDPEISAAIDQRRSDLEKEAQSAGIFEVGDDFGISFSEDLEIATEIVDILEDGIVIDLDEHALEMLANEGITFLEGEVVNEEKQKGVDGKACWKGYKRMGTKMKGGKRVDNCVKMGESVQADFEKGKFYIVNTGGQPMSDPMDKTRDVLRFDSKEDAYNFYHGISGKEADEYTVVVFDGAKLQPVDSAGVDEAKYQGREVPLGKKMAGDVKKSKVYVRKPNGNIVKVNFGDKKMRIKKSNPARRKSFRARHNCKNPGPRWKARYWSCRSW